MTLPFVPEVIELSKYEAVSGELADIKNSKSFRVGRAITWAPRKVRGGLRCLRDNGAGYTVRRTLYHMGLWGDEKVSKEL